jgi:hypothetical protein
MDAMYSYTLYDKLSNPSVKYVRGTRFSSIRHETCMILLDNPPSSCQLFQALGQLLQALGQLLHAIGHLLHALDQLLHALDQLLHNM